VGDAGGKRGRRRAEGGRGRGKEGVDVGMGERGGGRWWGARRTGRGGEVASGRSALEKSSNRKGDRKGGAGTPPGSAGEGGVQKTGPLENEKTLRGGGRVRQGGSKTPTKTGILRTKRSLSAFPCSGDH